MADGIFILEGPYGSCPVQAEGMIDGTAFYFRSRGDGWSFGVGRDPVGDPAWEFRRRCYQWPDAGYITVEEAMALINHAAALYRLSCQIEREATDG